MITHRCSVFQSIMEVSYRKCESVLYNNIVAITTTTEIGQNVLTVVASDPDISFGPVVYEIVRTSSSDDSSRFNIERSTGVIVTAASFLEDAGKQFQFTVEAKDQNGENEYNSAQAMIIVSIIDVICMF